MTPFDTPGCACVCGGFTSCETAHLGCVFPMEDNPADGTVARAGARGAAGGTEEGERAADASAVCVGGEMGEGMGARTGSVLEVFAEDAGARTGGTITTLSPLGEIVLVPGAACGSWCR